MGLIEIAVLGLLGILGVAVAPKMKIQMQKIPVKKNQNKSEQR